MRERAAPRPIRSILVPTDFSTGAGFALRRATLLPLAAGAKLHIVHVLSSSLPSKLRPRAADDARARLERTLEQAREARGPARIEFTSELLQGDAFLEIVRAARRTDTELVVLGRHGRRPIRDMFIGTTAERVIRKGDVPILVVHSEPTRAYRRPIIALDLEDNSRRTIEWGLRALGPDVKTIQIVHAYGVPFEGFIMPSLSARELAEWRRSFRQDAAKAIAKLASDYRRGNVRWKSTIRPGDPRAVVLTAAKRRRADLIVVATHGRSGVAHALLGSVAEWIITAAPCDVLVARPERFSFEPP